MNRYFMMLNFMLVLSVIQLTLVLLNMAEL